MEKRLMSSDRKTFSNGRRKFKHSAMLGMALLSVRVAAAQTSPAVETPGGPANVINDMTFEDGRRILDLSPNATCGYVRVTLVSKRKIAPGGMQAPFADGRPAGSALYFMLTPAEPVKLYRIRERSTLSLHHYYLGDLIEVLVMLEDGSTEFHVVGPDLRKGHQCSCISQAAHSTPHV
jgi:predicted cupin superfamily sugar epimerase